MKTNYQVHGKDLGEIFKHRKPSDPKAQPTGFLVSGTDLAEIFVPYSGGRKANPVGFKVKGKDLSEIFDPI